MKAYIFNAVAKIPVYINVSANSLGEAKMEAISIATRNKTIADQEYADVDQWVIDNWEAENISNIKLSAASRLQLGDNNATDCTIFIDDKEFLVESPTWKILSELYSKRFVISDNILDNVLDILYKHHPEEDEVK